MVPDSPDAMLTDRAKNWNTSKSPGAITLGALAPIAEKDCGSELDGSVRITLERPLVPVPTSRNVEADIPTLEPVGPNYALQQSPGRYRVQADFGSQLLNREFKNCDVMACIC